MEFITAVAAGLKDSLSPCALATMSLFICALLILAHEGQAVLNFGVYFLGTVFLVSLGILLGWADFFLGTFKAQNILRLLQIFLGYMLILLGGIHLYDWACLKIYPDRKRAVIPYPFKESIPGSLAKLLAVVAGVLLMTAQSVWPPDYGLAVLFYNAYLPGKFFTAFVGMAVYTFFLMLPMVFIFGLCYTGARRGSLSVLLEQQTAMIKIVLAGFFVSLGIGLIQVFS